MLFFGQLAAALKVFITFIVELLIGSVFSRVDAVYKL